MSIEFYLFASERVLTTFLVSFCVGGALILKRLTDVVLCLEVPLIFPQQHMTFSEIQNEFRYFRNVTRNYWQEKRR